MTRPAARRGVVAVVTAGLLALVVGALPAAAATGDPTSDATPAADPSVSSAPDATSTEAAGPADGATAPVKADAVLNVGGVLFVSGVRTRFTPERNPLGGVLRVEMTIRNATDQVLDASASYGATTLLGLDLGGASSLAIRDLAPGEVRAISADIRGIGQWAVVKAHMTVRPPANFRGVELPPLDRERWVFAPPWYLVGLVVLVVAATWMLRRVRLAGPRPRRSLRLRRSSRPRGGVVVPAVERPAPASQPGAALIGAAP